MNCEKSRDHFCTCSNEKSKDLLRIERDSKKHINVIKF